MRVIPAWVRFEKTSETHTQWFDRGCQFVDSQVSNVEQSMKSIGQFVRFSVKVPVFAHLWYLWFLCWFIVGFVSVVWLWNRLGLHRVRTSFIVSPNGYGCMIGLTVLAQMAMENGDLRFGPETSTSLLPSPFVLFYHAVFFCFGTLIFDEEVQSGNTGYHWIWWLSLSFLFFLPVGLMTYDSHWFIGWSIYVIAQITYAWAMTLGCIGIFRRFAGSESATMKYLSEASYWMYLAHLPLIQLMGWIVRDCEISPLYKFAIVTLVTSSILLVTYHWLVRNKLAGHLLNGSAPSPQQTSN